MVRTKVTNTSNTLNTQATTAIRLVTIEMSKLPHFYICFTLLLLKFLYLIFNFVKSSYMPDFPSQNISRVFKPLLKKDTYL